MSIGQSDVTRVTTIGGPTALIEYGGLRLLIDPTFDEPGVYGRGAYSLEKLTGPALSIEAVGRVDAVLLSHDQHPDNLDRSGRSVVSSAPLTLTTPAGAQRLGGSSVGLTPWSSRTLAPGSATPVQVTAVPAQHGPDGTEHIMGAVTGFVLESAGLPRLYISGDNASLEVVQQIRDRLGPTDLAVLFAGGAQTPALGTAYLTLSSPWAAEAARILNARYVIPVHYEGWRHFSEGAEHLERAFAEQGLAARLLLGPHGAPWTLPAHGSDAPDTGLRAPSAS